MNLNIEIGKTYNYFDDGKIRESRRMPVVITDIIPFNEVDSETKGYWIEDVADCHWVYAKETDYFIKGNLLLDETTEGEIEKIIFVRTVDNDWFSLGWWAGTLDVDGSLTNLLS